MLSDLPFALRKHASHGRATRCFARVATASSLGAELANSPRPDRPAGMTGQSLCAQSSSVRLLGSVQSKRFGDRFGAVRFGPLAGAAMNSERETP